MPRKRRVSKGRAPVTQEAVSAYHAGDFLALHRALDLRPWEASPVHANELPDYPVHGFETARALRLELEAA